ncbi:MAG: hypothetical protein B7733_15540 [Myxococcales bacterium FL481]|nr:MAG: hypothetical protein B7733_15540 [Myxococcales bacterium FL481]
MPFVVTALVAVTGCDDDDHGDEHDDDHGHEHPEVMSRVELVFQPADGGAPINIVWEDSDGDAGPAEPVIDPIELTVGTEYTLGLSFKNTLDGLNNDITPEIRDEAEEHFVLLYGDIVMGPAAAGASPLIHHAYADLESTYGPNEVGEDLPVGLSNQIMVVAPGTGELRLMLRHMPPLNGTPQKTPDVPDQFVAGEQIAGDVDVDIRFPFTSVAAG